jgi:hypothetical protein
MQIIAFHTQLRKGHQQITVPQLSMHGSTIAGTTLEFVVGCSLPGGFCGQQATFRLGWHILEGDVSDSLCDPWPMAII